MISYSDNQTVQRSPKMIKSFIAQQTHQASNKSPQKSEINHFIKKNTVIPAQQQMSKFHIGGQLSQVESQQSIKTSPVKSDVMGQKHYPQSIQKAQTHKTQKIKIGMHKKAVSLMGSSHTSQLSNFQHGEQNFLDYTKQSMNMMNINSQKQSHVPSSQTSFNDYSSGNNINYADVKTFPKVDNFTINDKTGSLLTAQQQQQVKQFQKILQEQQFQQQTFDHTDQREAALIMASGLKSFDQRPPIASNHILSNTQSQRMSIASDSIQQQNQGYRSQANSFKAVNNTNIAMKHPPNKYIKGNQSESQQNLIYNQPVSNPSTQGQTATLKSKKSLQYNHQRTFSDNPAFSNNNKNPLFNPNLTGQATNRNFQELIRSVNSKDQFSENFMNHIGLSPALTQDAYPIGITGTNSTINQSNAFGGHQFAGKTTIASSRQSAQSQILIDERDIINQHYQAQLSAQEMNQFYQAQLKDQFLKTKQALKMTQQQFGGPSRKVVQGNRLNGSANTQSYRINNQQTLTGSSISKMTFQGVEQKQTPKIMDKSSGKSSANQSYNASAHGARTTNNQTSINSTSLSQNQQILYSDKIKKQKPLKQKTTIDPNNIGVTTLTNLNFIQAPSEITISKQAINKSQSKSIVAGGAHKRSISDGNQIFQSLSGRGQMNQMQINQYAQAMKNQGQNPGILQNINMPANQVEQMKQSYHKQHSLSKIPPGQNSYTMQQRQIMNEYPITSDRGPYNQGNGQAIQNPSILISSHRKIGGLEQAKHIRHNSDQFTLESDKTQQKQPSVLANSGKNMITQNKIGIKSQKSQKEISTGNEMMIQDQGINQISQSIVNKKNILESSNLSKISPLIQKDDKNNTFYNKNSNPSTTLLKPVEERIETQESAASDPSLTPRSRMNFKINKKIKLAFSKPSANPIFTTQTDFYKIGKVMGKGAFGKVNLAIHRLSNKFVALKSINKQFLSEEASKRKVMQEFNILRRTRHNSIVRLYESFETAQHIVFVMEVCGSGDLLTYVRRRRKLKEDVAKHMFKQIIEGLRYCHSKNILHRDIKLDNILLNSEGDIKICDFGVSKLVKPGEIMTEQCGTPAYIAPEVFENKGYEGYASDIWSAGVVLYAMLYGTVPFKANNMTELQKQITKCQTTFKDEISPEAISLLKGILERDPQKRLKVSEIMKHQWMQDIPEIVSVFTEQEKEKVIQEFAYYNFKNDQGSNENGEIIHTDPFTEQMLNSTQNSLVKNASTKSVILAPFNSTRSHIDDNFHNRKSIQDLLIDKKNIKFAAKVKEIDRQYEANNNAELDNGVYHQDSEEEKKEEEEKKNNKKNGSIETSFDKDDEYGNHEDGGKKKQSEWQKLEKMVIDRQKTEEEEEDKEEEKNFNLGSAQTIILDDRIISEIERHGLPRNYIVNCLNNDDLNYITTYYYLLTTQKEY